MKKCKYCQSEIDINAKVCPKCGKKQGMPIWLIIIIIILAIIVIASLGSSETNNKEEQTGTTSKTKENVVLEEGHTGSLDEYGTFYYINGYVKNNSDKDYSYVGIEFTTYDNEGNTLGTCLDNNSSLEANGRWKFSAICTDDVKNIASYKLKEITKY